MSVSGLNTAVIKKWGYTLKKVDKFSYTWSIINFPICCEEMDVALVSPTFSSDTNDKLHWCLKLNVKGTDEEAEDYISLFLQMAAPSIQTKVKTKFRLSILNAEGEQFHATKNEKICVFEKLKIFGYTKFFKRDSLLDKSQGFLSEDILTILCEITVSQDNVAVTGQSNPLQIKVANCTLSEDFGQLFEDQKLCDVILLVKGTELKAHKAILAARSPVFAAMFEHDMEEKCDGKVKICDFDADIIEEMLRFIYTGKTFNFDKMAEGLLRAADKYDLNRLKTLCEEELGTNLSIENASRLLIVADLCNANQLKNQAIDFINQNSAVVKETAGFKTMFKSHPYLIAEAFRALNI